MKTNYLLFSAIAVVLLFVIFYSFSDLQMNNSYVEGIVAERKEKDAFFKHDEDSPIAPSLRKKFQGLRYFPVDASFRLTADLTLVPMSDTATLRLQTTTGEERLMRRYGIARFRLGGEEHQLTLFVSSESPHILFVPFNDPTNGKETYQTGRYMDIPLPKNRRDQIVIDFNTAYNPYCAYNDQYSCPIPPPENRLKIPIRAGEMSYQDK
ncbi:MAG: DUF1684 domain-containing protein [Cytophagales bacterium]|nr:DUF1684 domain-containing protein [Bernardetiaceae bacterium]MDW8204871.1 DUF1684 domain-containing protein [Cytophagales bacterium]